jgi:pyruvate dehydrogenase (quinone)
MTGLFGFSSGYRAMEHCDALLMLGTDFPYRSFYPENAKIVQVDIRGEHIGRRVPVDVALVGTVKDTLEALLPRLATSRDGAHLERMRAHYRRARARLDTLADPTAIGARSIRSGSSRRWTRSQRTMPCSPSTLGRPQCGARATCA